MSKRKKPEQLALLDVPVREFKRTAFTETERRNRERYRHWLRVADAANMSFGEWLKAGGYDYAKR